ncbi:MAG: hypothetical protein ACK4UJ_07710 [Leptonema sp. (in: bacteria)]
MGIFLSLSFGINKGSIVICDTQNNKCKYAVEKLGFPNGIAIYKEQLFVSTTFEHKIYRFNIEKDFVLTNKKEITEVKGGDNLIIFNNKLYVTSHPSFWKFLKHSSNTENPSPSIGYEIDLENYNKKIIFSDEGSRLSASSVILRLNQNMYIGQVFDPFLLYCKTP